MKLASLALASVLFMQAADPAYIVGLYPSKESRGLGPQFTLRVDGKNVARLRFPTYYRVAVPPGVYNVTFAETSGGDRRLPILCHLIAGETCYIRVRTFGKEDRPEVELLPPSQAWLDLRNLIPLEKERVYLQMWQ